MSQSFWLRNSRFIPVITKAAPLDPILSLINSNYIFTRFVQIPFWILDLPSNLRIGLPDSFSSFHFISCSCFCPCRGSKLSLWSNKSVLESFGRCNIMYVGELQVKFVYLRYSSLLFNCEVEATNWLDTAQCGTVYRNSSLDPPSVASTVEIRGCIVQYM